MASMGRELNWTRVQNNYKLWSLLEITSLCRLVIPRETMKAIDFANFVTNEWPRAFQPFSMF